MKGNHQNQIILYMHAGSGNHGCEAIVNSLCHMMKEDAVLVSYRGNEDWQYTLKELCEIKQLSLIHILIREVYHMKKTCVTSRS